MIILLFCNAPTFLPTHVNQGVETLRNDPNLDSATTVAQYNWYAPVRARRIRMNGRLQPFIPFECYQKYLGTINCDRDAQGNCWFANVCVSVVRPYNLAHLDYGILPL